jgi:hypothetical protein
MMNKYSFPVRKFLDVDVLKAVLAMRRDEGIAGSQPSSKNFRFLNRLFAGARYLCLNIYSLLFMYICTVYY